VADGSQQPGVAFWAEEPEALLASLGVSADGLTSPEADKRLARFGPNRLSAKNRRGPLRLLLAQFTSPIILILLAAAALSLFLGDRPDAIIIFAIVAVSGLLTFYQERGAADAVEKLLAVVEVKAQVLRDGAEAAVPHEQIVPGDVVMLSAGSTIPADAYIVEGHELFVDEATLTGETFPVEKQPGVLPATTPLAERANSVFMGTHVVSGTALAVVVRTGASTEFGAVSEHLAAAPAETEFEHGVRRFGSFLMEITLLLVIAIFASNVLLRKPVIDSFLFSLALAVGLTPQLLPAIISINLAHGARRMAKRRVIVKRLDSIEDFGSMDILCSDKTGTLTTGVVSVHAAYDTAGDESDDVLLYAYLNSYFETGFSNPIDDAIRTTRPFDVSRMRKLDEEPYDFQRKRLTVLVERDGKPFMVTKGAVDGVLSVCTKARTRTGAVTKLDEVRGEVERQYRTLSDQGYRTLGLAVRDDLTEKRIDASHESGMTFVGLLALFDPPKPDAATEVAHLRELGVALKIITGDNRLVARTVSAQMGLESPDILTGPRDEQDVRAGAREAGPGSRHLRRDRAEPEGEHRPRPARGRPRGRLPRRRHQRRLRAARGRRGDLGRLRG
jgi:Mg2+-importing ATPase